MVLDTLDNLEKYASLNPLFAQAIDYLKNTDLNEPTLPLSQKYMLTIKEASVYFNIGMKKLRRLAEENLGEFAVYSGNRFLINRTKFEAFLSKTSAV